MTGETLRVSLQQLAAHVGTPLYRNGYALVFSSAVTSGLGFVYWLIAARLYSVETVGLNSALLSAMMFLGGVAQFNLVNVLNRFLPAAGGATRAIVAGAYLVSLTAAGVASLAFVRGLGLWAPALDFIAGDPALTAWLVAATMAWCVFALQDGVLTGLRQASWVPVENTIFAVAKIGLLVGLAGAAPGLGVFASWTIAVAVIIPPVNVLIFRYLIPRHARATAERADPVALGHVVHFVAGDHLASILWMATTTLLPILVTQLAGAAANAFYYLPWTIAYSLYLVSRNMGMSMIAEAAQDRDRLETYAYRVMVQTARLLVPAVAAIAIGAPYLLRLFGEDYASEGASLLRLLSLAALPNLVTSVYTSMARVQRRLRAVVLVQGIHCVLVLGLGAWLLAIYGIVGLGLAWLFSQSLIAAVLLITRFRGWFPAAGAGGGRDAHDASRP